MAARSRVGENLAAAVAINNLRETRFPWRRLRNDEHFDFGGVKGIQWRRYVDRGQSPEIGYALVQTVSLPGHKFCMCDLSRQKMIFFLPHRAIAPVCDFPFQYYDPIMQGLPQSLLNFLRDHDISTLHGSMQAYAFDFDRRFSPGVAYTGEHWLSGDLNDGCAPM